MKKFFKALAILIIIAHVFAVLVYIGIIPAGLFTELHLPDPASFAEFLLRASEEAKEEEDSAGLQVPSDEEEKTEEEEPAAEKTEENAEELPPEEKNAVQISLSENLPDLTEEDLYDLTDVLVEAGALKAAGPGGEDISDQIFCDLAADINDPGHFTAVFSVRTEDGNVQRGPSADLQVEMTEPFLAFREDEVNLSTGTDYDPYRNILICMDVDGTVLTEFVAIDGYLNTDEPGDYELRFYIYSRVNGSSASRTMTFHVEREG
jgi:hypothetical protein